MNGVPSNVTNLSPKQYSISTNPTYKLDNSFEMGRGFDKIRNEQEMLLDRKKEIVAGLDSMNGDFVALFNALRGIREKLDMAKSNSLVTDAQKHSIDRIFKIIDKINEVIVVKIAPLVDTLEVE